MDSPSIGCAGPTLVGSPAKLLEEIERLCEAGVRRCVLLTETIDDRAALLESIERFATEVAVHFTGAAGIDETR